MTVHENEKIRVYVSIGIREYSNRAFFVATPVKYFLAKQVLVLKYQLRNSATLEQERSGCGGKARSMILRGVKRF